MKDLTALSWRSYINNSTVSPYATQGRGQRQGIVGSPKVTCWMSKLLFVCYRHLKRKERKTVWVQCIVGRLWTNQTGSCVCVYLELHQVDVHVSGVAVLCHGVRELRDALAGRSQPRLDLGEVEDDLPVSYGVERRRLHRPEATQTRRESGPVRPTVVHYLN